MPDLLEIIYKTTHDIEFEENCENFASSESSMFCHSLRKFVT